MTTSPASDLPAAPRIAPVEPPFAPALADQLAAIMPAGVPPLRLFTTLARSPRVFQRFLAGALLDRGALSLRQRELMIDRTCARLGNAYEWGVHVTWFGARIGLDDAQRDALARGPWDAPVFAPAEQAILRLADELYAGARISDAAWALVRAHFDDDQALELIALAGFYRTVAYYCCGLALPLEPIGAPLPT